MYPRSRDDEISVKMVKFRYARVREEHDEGMAGGVAACCFLQIKFFAKSLFSRFWKETC